MALVVGLVLLEGHLDSLLPAKGVEVTGQDLPPKGVGASSHRILPAVAGPRESSSYRFAATQKASDDPVTYDPCRIIHYVIRQGSAPATALILVRQAVATVSAASGLQFVDDGPTDEAPTAERDPYQPDRYGKRWAPVLIAWSSPGETPGLAGRVAGLAGSRPWADTHGHLTYVTGMVRLDTPALLADGSEPGSAAEVRAVIIHELGHVLGLAHVPDRTQLMFADNVGQTALGAGDRQGLALAGAGSCVSGL